jgi:hypothetical protein
VFAAFDVGWCARLKPFILAVVARGIDVDGFVPIPLEQLRISLDVSPMTVQGVSTMP